jgi:hypothetical protein
MIAGQEPGLIYIEEVKERKSKKGGMVAGCFLKIIEESAGTSPASKIDFVNVDEEFLGVSFFHNG